MVALATQTDTFGVALVFYLGGLFCIQMWEKTPWSLTRELARVCRRLDMRKVDMIYDARTENVVAIVITKDGDVRSNIDITVPPEKESE